jgi:hypothetical protein
MRNTTPPLSRVGGIIYRRSSRTAAHYIRSRGASFGRPLSPVVPYVNGYSLPRHSRGFLECIVVVTCCSVEPVEMDTPQTVELVFRRFEGLGFTSRFRSSVSYTQSAEVLSNDLYRCESEGALQVRKEYVQVRQNLRQSLKYTVR